MVCLDLGGPSIQVTDETGIRVLAQNPDQAVEDLAQAMVDLAHDRDRRSAMGHAGQRRVREHYHWGVRGRLYSRLYASL